MNVKQIQKIEKEGTFSNSFYEANIIPRYQNRNKYP